MRSIMISTLAFFTVVAFVFFGCECGPNQPGSLGITAVQQLPQPSGYQPLDYSELRNPNNPYDMVGETHNNFAHYSYLYFEQYGHTANIDVISTLMEDFMQDSVLYINDQGESIYATAFLNDWDWRNQTDSIDYYRTHLGDFLSTQALAYLDEIRAIYEDTVISYTADDRIHDLKILENQIINGCDNFSSMDSALVLGSVSIAKASTYYWNRALVDEPNWPAIDDFIDNPLSKTLKELWDDYWAIGYADNVDGLVGSAAGFTMSWLGGPKAAVAGAIIGFIAAGGRSSVAEAEKREWL